MKAAFLDYATVDAGDLDNTALLDSVAGLHLHASTHDDELAGHIGDSDIVLLNKTRLSAATFASHPALQLVCLAATGSDNVDLEAAAAHNVAVCNIRDYCTESVVQHVFTLILTLTRNVDGYRLLTARGAWHDSDQFCLLTLPIADLADMTIGIVGYGALGRGVARVAEAFGMQVLVAGRDDAAEPGRVPLAQLLQTSDIVSLHCPLTAATNGLIGAAELARMRSSALLINTARGALVDSTALADALRRRRIAGAGVDVLPQEPPVDGDPLLDDDIPNLVLTPHIAWASRRARQRALDEMAANVAAFAAGRPRNIITATP